jgi:hypothetical protein
MLICECHLQPQGVRTHSKEKEMHELSFWFLYEILKDVDWKLWKLFV